MKEVISLHFNSRGLFIANSAVVNKETKVTCRSVLEEYPLFSKGTLLQKELIIKALRKTSTISEGMAVVPDGEVISRVLPLPPNLSQKQVISGLRHSLRGKLPGDPEDYGLNYYIPSPQHLIYVTALPKEMIRDIQEIFEKVGIRLKSIAPLTSALSASLASGTARPTAFLSYTKEELDLGIGYHDFLTYSAVLRTDSSSSRGGGTSKEALDNTFRELGLQLNRHFKAYETQISLPIESLYLVGDWETLGPIDEVKSKLNSLLGLRVSPCAFPSQFSPDASIKTSQEAQAYIPAISGLSLLERASQPYIGLQRDFTSNKPFEYLPVWMRWAAVGTFAFLIVASFGLETFFNRKSAPFHPSPPISITTPPPPFSPSPPEPEIQGPPRPDNKKKKHKINENAPLSESIRALSALSENGINLESVTLESNGFRIVGLCQEEGSIHAGLDELSKSPKIEHITLEEITRDKNNKLKFTALLDLKEKP